MDKATFENLLKELPGYVNGEFSLRQGGIVDNANNWGAYYPHYGSRFKSLASTPSECCGVITINGFTYETPNFKKVLTLAMITKLGYCWGGEWKVGMFTYIHITSGQAYWWHTTFEALGFVPVASTKNPNSGNIIITYVHSKSEHFMAEGINMESVFGKGDKPKPVPSLVEPMLKLFEDSGFKSYLKRYLRNTL